MLDSKFINASYTDSKNTNGSIKDTLRLSFKNGINDSKLGERGFSNGSREHLDTGLKAYKTGYKFNPKKRLTFYNQTGKRWCKVGSRQAKRNQSENYTDSQDQNDYRKTANGYPYYGAQSKLINVNKKARQLPNLGQNLPGPGKCGCNRGTGEKCYICAYSDNTYGKKSQTAAFRAKPNPVPTTITEDGEIVSPRAQKYNKIIGDQIRIEINNQKVEIEELNSNPLESKNLLFYDFNSSARQFSFGFGNNPRLATRAEFRSTGMAGAKLIDVNKIQPSDVDMKKAKRRPTTSHFRGGDRLPSRASKTRERAKRIQMAVRSSAQKKQKSLGRKIIHMPDYKDST